MKLFMIFVLLMANTLFAAEKENVQFIITDGIRNENYKVLASVETTTDEQGNEYKALKIQKDDGPNKAPRIKWILNTQLGVAEVVSNYTKIPNDSNATQFDLPEGTVESLRVYLSAVIDKKHEIRLLFAPLEYEGEFVSDKDIMFNGTQFLAGKTTTAGYKFNSYRLSYIYHFDANKRFKYRIGFSAKVRDAYTLLKQDGVESKYTNVGFVPLLHLGVNILLSEKLSLDAEVEGSWAPQGYAIDLRTSLDYSITDSLKIGLGVGVLDGGAENDKVKTFSDILFGFVGVKYEF